MTPRQIMELEEQEAAAASLDDAADYPRLFSLTALAFWDRFCLPVIGLAGFVGVLLLYKYGWALMAAFGMEF